LLDAAEQTLFVRLGVFVGGCTLEAATAVCNAMNDLPIDVTDGIASLLEKSLLKQVVEAASPGGSEVALRLAGALFWFWEERSYLSEGRRWLEGALRPTNEPARTAARAPALFAAGVLAAMLGDLVAARARLEESVAIWREVGDKRGLALALTYGHALG